MAKRKHIYFILKMKNQIQEILDLEREMYKLQFINSLRKTPFLL